MGDEPLIKQVLDHVNDYVGTLVILTGIDRQKERKVRLILKNVTGHVNRAYAPQARELDRWMKTVGTSTLTVSDEKRGEVESYWMSDELLGTVLIGLFEIVGLFMIDTFPVAARETFRFIDAALTGVKIGFPELYPVAVQTGLEYAEIQYESAIDLIEPDEEDNTPANNGQQAEEEEETIDFVQL